MVEYMLVTMAELIQVHIVDLSVEHILVTMVDQDPVLTMQ